MKILVLEHPRLASRDHFNDIANTPLWSCLMGGYAAAALKAGGAGAVRYLDAAGRGLTFDQVSEVVLDHAPDLLCVNAVYFWEHTLVLFGFFDGLRQKGFGGHITLFGFFPTQVFSDILTQCGAVDSVAVGECEQTLGALADALAAGKGIGDIDGLAVRIDDEPVLARVRRPMDKLDLFPFPERDAQAQTTATLLGSRGCYNQCSFCPIPGFYNNGPLWRGRSPENIAEEIAGLKQAGCRDFYFADPNFIGPGEKGRERAMRLARLLSPLRITFGMETRPGDLTQKVLIALRKAGLTSLLLGVESGSAEQLDAINKHQAPDVSARAITLCRQAGIEPQVGFILFMADSLLADVRQGYAFLVRNQLLDSLERTVNLLSHRQIVLKGATGYNHFLRQGRLSPGGCFGYQGRVAFSDPRVDWLAMVWLPVCRYVLSATAREASPVFWANPSGKTKDRVNKALIRSFEALLAIAGAKNPLPEPQKTGADWLRCMKKSIHGG